MKRTIFIIIGFLLFSFSELTAQQYTAAEYWKMEHDPVYIMLLQKQNTGESLSMEEQKTLAEYKNKLSVYFEKLSDNEKSIYFKNRAKWDSQPGSVNMTAVQQETDVYSGERSMYTSYLISSGTFGFLYGTAAAYILGVNSEGGLTVAIPLLVAGTSTLIPMLSIKDKNVSYNSLTLSIHGKAIGALQGAALGVLLTGENIEDGKLILGLSALSSIGLGRLGYTLGRDKPWSQGRAALYTHYGFLMPLEGLALDVAFKSENPRVYALTSLLFGAGGYLIADRVAQWHDYTRGDVSATSTLSFYNTVLGIFIMSDITDRSGGDLKRSSILIPAAGALAGTLAGHLWLKDARLTNQQGRNTALAFSGGAVIGLGLTALVKPESITPYYTISYITGLGSYAILLAKYKQSKNIAYTEQEKKNRWNLNLMPQNILLNQKIATYANPGKRINFLPAFSASINF